MRRICSTRNGCSLTSNFFANFACTPHNKSFYCELTKRQPCCNEKRERESEKRYLGYLQVSLLLFFINFTKVAKASHLKESESKLRGSFYKWSSLIIAVCGGSGKHVAWKLMEYIKTPFRLCIKAILPALLSSCSERVAFAFTERSFLPAVLFKIHFCYRGCGKRVAWERRNQGHWVYLAWKRATSTT